MIGMIRGNKCGNGCSGVASRKAEWRVTGTRCVAAMNHNGNTYPRRQPATDGRTQVRRDLHESSAMNQDRPKLKRVMTEHVNQELETYLRLFTSNRPEEWSKILPMA